MAERRMLSKKVIYKDSFSELPDKAKILYLYLLLEADDDGFVGNSKNVMRICGANKQSLEALILRGFAIRFDSGVIALSHWSAQNKVAKDRYNPTVFAEEFSRLVTDSKGVYHLRDEALSDVIQNVDRL